MCRAQGDSWGLRRTGGDHLTRCRPGGEARRRQIKDGGRRAGQVVAGSVSVLIVDDEPAILQSTRLLAEDLGFEVVATARAEEVLALVRLHRPNVLLQDVRMPGLDLGRLVSDLRALPEAAHLRIVLFSATMDLEEIARQVEPSAILEKPFRPQDLQAALTPPTAA